MSEARVEIVFDMIVSSNGHEWKETYCIEGVDTLPKAYIWADRCIRFFNDSLRSHETPRRLVGVDLNIEVQMAPKDNQFSE